MSTLTFKLKEIDRTNMLSIRYGFYTKNSFCINLNENKGV